MRSWSSAADRHEAVALELGAPWPRRYVVLGDSFCAGLEEEPFPAWPKLLELRLREWSPDLQFVDVAEVGALAADVSRTQVPCAVDLGADLIALSCGANDVLLTVAPDLEAVERELRGIFHTLAARLPAAMVVSPTYGDFSPFLPFRPRSQRRVAVGLRRVNDVIRELSAAHGFLCLDVAALPAARRREAYGADGLHASQAGHERIAVEQLEALRTAAPVRPAGIEIPRPLNEVEMAPGVVPV